MKFVSSFLRASSLKATSEEAQRIATRTASTKNKQCKKVVFPQDSKLQVRILWEDNFFALGQKHTKRLNTKTLACKRQNITIKLIRWNLLTHYLITKQRLENL